MCKGIGITVTVRVSVVGAAIARPQISDRVVKSNHALIARASCTGTLAETGRNRSLPEVHHTKLDLIGMWNVTGNSAQTKKLCSQYSLDILQGADMQLVRMKAIILDTGSELVGCFDVIERSGGSHKREAVL